MVRADSGCGEVFLLSCCLTCPLAPWPAFRLYRFIVSLSNYRYRYRITEIVSVRCYRIVMERSIPKLSIQYPTLVGYRTRIEFDTIRVRHTKNYVRMSIYRNFDISIYRKFDTISTTINCSASKWHFYNSTSLSRQ